MHIGLLTSLTAPNSAYRGLPLLELERHGHTVVRGMKGTEMRLDELSGCDVVHIHRYHERRVRDAVRRLRDAGTAIVWDNDDDLADVPGLRRKDALRSQQAQAEMRAIAGLAHVVTTPSAVLAQQYRAWGAAHVEVVENYLPVWYAVDAPPPPGEGVTIGWAAASEHRYDFEQLGLRDVLLELLDAHRHVRVVSVSLDLGLRAERYRHQPTLQYPDLASCVATFDVGIAPIADIPFNRARSNVKLKEYAAVGVPWLASPIGPYAGLGSREGGELVSDDGWRAALARLVENGRLRRKLAARGRKWASGQTVTANLGAWERVLTLAVERSRPARTA
ncbi:MAG TPA: hypothetical protein VFV85_05760 [Conexibacter sp.]|nr:hypothetical protein [Conexibacter sp.]